MQPHADVLGVRTSTCEFWGHSQPLTRNSPGSSLFWSLRNSHFSANNPGSHITLPYKRLPISLVGVSSLEAFCQLQPRMTSSVIKQTERTTCPSSHPFIQTLAGLHRGCPRAQPRAAIRKDSEVNVTNYEASLTPCLFTYKKKSFD